MSLLIMSPYIAAAARFTGQTAVETVTGTGFRIAQTVTVITTEYGIGTIGGPTIRTGINWQKA
jgi:hypothetical protein